jgi:predicted RNase H-like nuclease (RuvC/YqgF family)
MSDDVQYDGTADTQQQDPQAAQDTQAPRDDQADDSKDTRSYTDRTVPYSRFREVNAENKRLKQQVEQFGGRLEELETRDQTELQRERNKRQQYERELSEMQERATRIERSGWLRDAAREAKFMDPEDAIAQIGTGEVEDYDDAITAVKQLAKRKPYMVRQEAAGPKVGEVMRDGRRQDGQRAQQDPRRNAPADAGMNSEQHAFLDQLRQAQENAGWQSVPFGD